MTGLGRLYLIPTLLGPSEVSYSLPESVREVVTRLDTFLVEEEKSARAFIKLLCPERIIRDVALHRLDKHTEYRNIGELLAPLRAGRDLGVLSEAGCPAIADPGALAVRGAHEMGAQVIPLVGPCSMLMALMASGFNGQRWRFVGYIPIEATARREAILEMERALYRFNESQIVMDTPYRNQRLLDDLCATCRPETLVCIASGLTTPLEWIRSRSIAAWRTVTETLPSGPSVFVLGANATSHETRR